MRRKSGYRIRIEGDSFHPLSSGPRQAEATRADRVVPLDVAVVLVVIRSHL
jgi:hypothetical protein